MRRILVVDDDPHSCLAVRVRLERYDFRDTIADGGANGLKSRLSGNGAQAWRDALPAQAVRAGNFARHNRD
jgi:hypothetical protein